MTSPGSYYTPDTTWTSGPTGVSDWLMLTVETMAPTFANDQKQTATALQSENTYVRCRVGGTWSAWQQLLTPAAKADQQAGTDNGLGVTPAHQQDHDSAAKAWALFHWNGSSLVTDATYNCTISRQGAGIYSISFTTHFASSSYGSKFQPRSQELLVKVRSRISITPVRALPQAANFALSTSL